MTFEARAYQQEAIADCVAAFADRERESLLLESPVGSGKTYMALETIHRLQERLGRPLKVNWVAPRRRLLQQMMEANRELHQDRIRPVSLFERTPPEADFVVLDEAHHEATQSCVTLYEKMKHTWTMGLSATPMRTDRMKLSFQESVRTCSIARLIREGYLSPFNSFLMPKYSVDTVADHYLSDPGRWGKSLVFFSTIAECIAFKERLRQGGIACEVVTGESDKDAQMEAYESGTVPVIANVAMLTEGFDQPDVRTVFARDASRLPCIQMCGRGLRRAPGKEACNIVQSADSPYLFERVAAARNAFRWSRGHWLALKDGTEAIEETLQETLRRIEVVQRKDRKNRKKEFERMERELPGRFARKLKQISNAERERVRFYEQFEDVYEALYEFYARVNACCFGGRLPACAFNLSTKTATDQCLDLKERFVRNGAMEYPALVVNVLRCHRLSARQFALHCLAQMVRLAVPAEQRAGVDVRAALTELGFDCDKRTYSRTSRCGASMAIADEMFVRLGHRLWGVVMSGVRVSAKADGAYFLKHLEAAESQLTSVPEDAIMGA